MASPGVIQVLQSMQQAVLKVGIPIWNSAAGSCKVSCRQLDRDSHRYLAMQENITFRNRRAQTLSGVLHKPATGPSRSCAVFAHCFTCSKNNRAATRISKALADEGITVLRFDFTGLG